MAYLKITLPLLMAARQPDEEIVVVDGGSSDGTREYLEGLHTQKLIQQFISEKDKGEAHGTNKAIMMAKGTLLKIITDDDVFDFNVIAFCRQHLLTHPEIDICGADGFGISTQQKSSFLVTRYCEGFMEWKRSGAPFLFCGLSYLIRRSSIAKLGLLSTQFTMIDLEYSIRVSAMNANIVFCNAYCFVNIVGADSNSNKFYANIKLEKNKLEKLYPNISNLNNPNNLYNDLKEMIKKVIKPAGRELKTNTGTNNADYQSTVAFSLEALKEKNKTISPAFL